MDDWPDPEVEDLKLAARLARHRQRPFGDLDPWWDTDDDEPEEIPSSD